MNKQLRKRLERTRERLLSEARWMRRNAVNGQQLMAAKRKSIAAAAITKQLGAE